jgi:hypothetical protein
VISAAQLGFEEWRAILLGLALELGAEAAALLFVSALARRPWRERLLVAVPFAGFVWVSLLARDLGAQATYWRVSLSWIPAIYLASGYPPNGQPPLLVQQTLQDYQHGLENANRMGWAAVLVTLALTLLGGALLLYWYSRVEKDVDERVAPISVDDDSNFTIEPLERAERS